MDAIDEAVKEYNCFGLALHSDNYKLPEKDVSAMKARNSKQYLGRASVTFSSSAGILQS